MKQNRWLSKVMWGGILVGIFGIYNAIATEFGLTTVDGASAAGIVVNVVCGIIAIFAAINNPTSKNTL